MSEPTYLPELVRLERLVRKHLATDEERRQYAELDALDKPRQEAEQAGAQVWYQDLLAEKAARCPRCATNHRTTP